MHHLTITERNTIITGVIINQAVPRVVPIEESTDNQTYSCSLCWSQSFRQEMTANNTLLFNELGKISSRVTAMEDQSVTAPTTQEQSIPAELPSMEQSLPIPPSNTTEQNLPTPQPAREQSLPSAEGQSPQDFAYWVGTTILWI